ncbi:hypothetical protein Cpir12675_003761 [Ceratocystis pirilliformis]|uniref:D-lactate dehydrogenase n=1 Tax=Ceratocystis pirilliformis TaxID=259994 RepID=A0ABR3Z0Y0_9PEZI
MKLVLFSSKSYDKEYFEAALSAEKENDLADVTIDYIEASLSPSTALAAFDADAVCVFVNDIVNTEVLRMLHKYGVRAILLRCAGHNNVDLETASCLGFFVAHVPSYSPEAVAEFAVALIQTLNRNTHRAYNRVREGNFSLGGLIGKTLHGKTVGVIGIGRIGLAFARIMHGFGCRMLAFDPFQNPAFLQYGTYLPLNRLLAQSDIVSLHCPLGVATEHIINEQSLAIMKEGTMLVNTSRGGLIDTKAVISALKRGHLGGLALDVYEGEGSIFYDDHSDHVIDDDLLMRLTTFHNVLISGHQAFFTKEAMEEIAECCLRNLSDFMHHKVCPNGLTQVPASRQE